MDDLGSDSGRQAIPHRATGRGELGAQAAIAIEALDPKRVIACTVADDRIRRQGLAQVHHHLAEIVIAAVTHASEDDR